MIRNGLRLLIILGTFFVLAKLPNIFEFNQKSQQARFNEWLAQLELASKNAPDTFKQHITVETKVGSAKYSFEFVPETHSWELLYRLLELISSTSVLNEQTDDTTSAGAQIYVRGFGEEFRTEIPKAMIESSNQLRIFFKLLEVNGKDISDSALALNKSKKENTHE